MSPPTRRSKAEREAFCPRDGTIPKVSDNQKVVSLDPPDRIKDHPDKLDCWNYICTDLAGRQLLSPSYIMEITILVDNIVAYNEYVVMLESSGPLIPMLSKDGNEITGYKENPLFGIVKRTEAAIFKLCEKFGLNPRDAVYTTNPDIKTQQVLEAKVSGPQQNKITYFQ